MNGLIDCEVTCMLPVKDLDRARTFYEACLGLAPQGLRPDGKFTYRLGGTTLALFPEPAVAALKARGVRFSDYDYPGLKTVNHVCVLGSEKAAWFEDTEGNILCLHEDLG